MASYRPLSILFAPGLAALALAACGSQEQSSGLLGITVESSVVINEVCASQDRCNLADLCQALDCRAASDSAACENACSEQQRDEHGYDDWIELYNSTDRDRDLEGYYLSDSSKHPLRTRLPAGLAIPGHGHLTLFANGSQGGRNLDFALSAGESAVLSSPSRDWLDQLPIQPELTGADERGSWARIPDGTGPLPRRSCFFPTPGWDNSTQCASTSP